MNKRLLIAMFVITSGITNQPTVAQIPDVGDMAKQAAETGKNAVGGVMDGLGMNLPNGASDFLTNKDVLNPGKPLSEEHQARLALVAAIRDRDPQPILDGNRLTYLYGEGQPSLVCAPLRVCVLALKPGERIANNGVLLGDATRWQVVQIYVDVHDAIHLAFKPNDAGLETSLSIFTDQRHYHIEMLSHLTQYMPFVGFRYQDDALADLNARIAAADPLGRGSGGTSRDDADLPSWYGEVSLDDLNFDYDISACGRCPWRPERVFDDGKRTIIVLPKEASTEALPALLIVGTESDSQVANYRFIDRAFHVDQLFSEARLTLGVGRKRAEVRITRQE